MPKIPFASHPLLLGFDALQATLETTAGSGGDSYPPYNIEQHESFYRVSIAVAGFAREDLAVTIEGNLLTVRGMRIAPALQSFAHQGIGARKFARSFVLAGCIDVVGAYHENGLLNIDLSRNTQSNGRVNIPIVKLE